MTLRDERVISHVLRLFHGSFKRFSLMKLGYFVDAVPFANHLEQWVMFKKRRAGLFKYKGAVHDTANQNADAASCHHTVP